MKPDNTSDQTHFEAHQAHQSLGIHLPGITDVDLLVTVLKHAPLVLWAIDNEGAFILSRGSGLQQIDLKDDQVVGQSLFELYKDYPDILDKVRRALHGEKIHDCVEVQGQEFESWYCPIVGKHGTIDGVVGISHVITELSQTKKALREENERFIRTFHRSPVLLMIVDRKTQVVTEVNQTFEKRTGCLKESILNHRLDELQVFSENPLLLDSPHHEHEHALELSTCQFGVRQVRVRSTPIRYQQADSLLISIRDIHDENQALTALERSEIRFEKMATLAPVGIFQCNQDGTLYFGNRCFWSCFDDATVQGYEVNLDTGYFPSQPDLRWYELFEESAELKYEWLQSVAENRLFQQRLIPVNSAANVEMVELQLDPVGQDRFIGTIFDMTAVQRAETLSAIRHQELEKAVQSRTAELRVKNQQLEQEMASGKRASEQLELSRNRLQTILENVLDQIVFVNREGRIEYINWTKTEIGIHKEDVIGTKVIDWVHESMRQECQEVLDAVLNRGENRDLEIKLQSPVRDAAIHQTRWAPVRLQQQIVGAAVIATDITEVRELEESNRLRHEELTHLSRVTLMGEMSARLAHELEQPLLSISSYATGCLNHLRRGAPINDEMLDYLDRVAELSQHAREIVQRTRDFVKKQPFHKEVSSISEIIDRSLEIVAIELGRSPIPIIKQELNSLPAVHVDPIQIQQVLVNLLLNAVDAIRSSKKKIPHQIIINSHVQKMSYLTLQVTDTGDGIPESQREHLFAAFHSTKDKGLGMGLAICRSILENHLGELRLADTSEVGTCFELDLPLH